MIQPRRGAHPAVDPRGRIPEPRRSAPEKAAAIEDPDQTPVDRRRDAFQAPQPTHLGVRKSVELPALDCREGDTGIESFGGTVFHSATWNRAHDLAGERVAVIGTGASAIQFVPQIQPTVGRLYLFQRTAPWIIPRWDRAFGRCEQWLFRQVPSFSASHASPSMSVERPTSPVSP